ncbi:hypothetical protein [Fundicoccus culcitae]|uniref:MucBP domain-containing protein n=1 Tax=Fundicoccus culcitae TaxID=2969821 RepID=A0ABY5P5R1_9LACT|nr:hypothetical protein [Fundicoccus culcitae]UUX33815.1 hypothetical protein NRE15_13135 [Fundicoccus culcitae]
MRQSFQKMVSKILLVVVVLMGFVHVPSIKAHNTADGFINQLDLEQTIDANIPTNDLEYLISELKKLNQLDNYRIDYMLTNNRNNKRMTHLVLYGDEEENIEATFNFYNDNFYPNSYQLQLLGFNNFELAYINQFGFLDSLAFFNKPHFPFDFDESLTEYQDYMLEVEVINRNNLDSPLLEQLLLLPDFDKLSQVSPSMVHRIDDYYILNLERLEIPDLLMRGHDLLNQKINSSITVNNNSSNSQLYDVVLSNSLDLSVQNRGLDFELNYETQLSDDLLPSYYYPEEYNSVNRVNTELYVKTSDIIDKITNVRITYNERTQRFHITLLGITENFNLNLFTSDSANFRSYEFQIDYIIQPSDYQLAELDDFQRMSEKEFNFILTNKINEVE